MYPLNFPILETDRLILNKPHHSDIGQLVRVMNETPEISENTLTIPYPYQEKDALFWINEVSDNGFKTQKQIIFAIREKSCPQLIGGIGIHFDKDFKKVEVGYWLAKEYWNKGYASEVLKKVVEYGFENLDMNKIYAAHFEHNPASGKVLQKAGMKFEGVLVQEIFKNNQYLDLTRYYILKSHFEAAK